MKTQQLDPEKKQEATLMKSAPFCLRLNALRALACISVICTHIVNYHHKRGALCSLADGGHMAVYFFFSRSGYLLSLSLVKEIRRHINSDEKGLSGSQKVQNYEKEKNQGNVVNLPQDSSYNKTDTIETNVLKGRIQISASCSIESFVDFNLGKIFMESNTETLPIVLWVLFLLKRFAKEKARILDLTGVLWKDILLLEVFPEHLWTMRIEMKFYYLVIPVYIIGLFIAFCLQKKGLKIVSTVCFFSIACALLLVAIDKMILKEDIFYPVKISENFSENLPPFFFGMLAALANFALELEEG